MRGTIEQVTDVPGSLWSVTTKVRGLSEVFNMAKGEPPFSEEGLCGVANLLEGIANDLDQIRDLIEYGKQPEPTVDTE